MEWHTWCYIVLSIRNGRVRAFDGRLKKVSRFEMKKILLIDDDPWIRDSMAIYFKNEGCSFRALESAEEGLTELNEHRYDVIIADYRLPGMNGVEFIRKIHPSHPETIKILISAYANDIRGIDAIQAGFQDFIQKPFDMQQIEDVLTRLAKARPPGPVDLKPQAARVVDPNGSTADA